MSSSFSCPHWHLATWWSLHGLLTMLPSGSGGTAYWPFLDNLAAHEVAGMREAVRRARAHVMLPPAYSPDLNPIEQAFAELKAGLRKAGTRTREALWDTIGHLLDTFRPSECQNHPTRSGHAFE